MTDLPQSAFTHQELVELQRIRALVVALQRMIADLDATEQNNDYNEQFNKARFEATAILRKNGFELDVPKAVTTNVLAERGQNVTTRLSGIVILGVIVALLGLGANSIILEDLLINSLGCLISSLGMLLVIGAFVVWGLTSTRRQLTNLGDLYIRSDALLQQLDQVLNTAVADYADRAAPVEVPNLPSAAALALDSLEKQATDWQQKLETLKQQRLVLGPNEPPELSASFNFVLRELDRIEYELVHLRQRVDFPLTAVGQAPTAKPSPPPPQQMQPDSAAIRFARSNTQEMPVIEPEIAPAPEPEEDTDQS